MILMKTHTSSTPSSGADPAIQPAPAAEGKIPLYFCDRCLTITELARAINRAPSMVQAFLRVWCAKKGGAWVGDLHDRLDRTTVEVVLEDTGFYAQWSRPQMGVYLMTEKRLHPARDLVVALKKAGGRLLHLAPVIGGWVVEIPVEFAAEHSADFTVWE